MNTQKMSTQGAVDVPDLSVPVSGTMGPLVGPCSGMWDGDEKGWTVVRNVKKRVKKGRK
jgi:hypothetical protein